jgi:hypothetical protein
MVKLADGSTVTLKLLAQIKPLETTADAGHEHPHH